MKRKTAAALLMSVLLLSTAANAAEVQSFHDYASAIQNSWAERYITTLVAKGGIKGYADGTFKPKEKITTAELVTIILNTSGTKANTTNWPQDVMQQAVDAGLLDASMLAEGNTPITREKMAYVLVNAASNLLHEDVSTVTLIDPSRIPDLGTASEQYQGDIRFAYSLGLLTGNNASGTFNPSGFTTREETCVIISRLFKFTERVDLSLTF